jgi:hypothetical protein
MVDDASGAAQPLLLPLFFRANGQTLWPMDAASAELSPAFPTLSSP